MSSALKIFVVSPDIRAERRIEPYWTVQLLKVRFCLLYESAIDAIPKDKLEVITGIPAQNQLISLLESEKVTAPLAQLTDNSRELSQYGLRDWQVLKVSNYTITVLNEAD